jgi:hypothetical protein
MMAEELVGIISVDEAINIIYPVSGKKLGSITLQHTLMNYLKMKDGHQFIAEVHQKSIQIPTYIIIPNTPDAETMICMMNKNLPAYLWHTFLEQGFPAAFVKELLKKSCEATALAKAATTNQTRRQCH